MDYEHFLEGVQRRTTLDPEYSDAVSRATLQTLAEQANASDMENLLAQLPAELTSAAGEQPAHRPIDEFYGYISDHAGVDDTDPTRAYVHSVFAVLGEAVGTEQVRRTVAGLSLEYQALLPEESGGADKFAARVQDRANLTSQQEAVKSTRAVLAALSDRVSEGEMVQLATALPTELRPYLSPGAPPNPSTSPASSAGSVRKQPWPTTTPPKTTPTRYSALFRNGAEQGQIDDTLAQLPPQLADMFS